MDQSRKIIIAAVLGSLVVAGAACSSVPANTNQTAINTNDTISLVELGFREDMRKVWVDHVVWTRLYIIAAVNGAPDTEQAANRLMKNQEDIGNVMMPYLGNMSSVQLTTLLKKHISIATDIISAAKVGDTGKQTSAELEWSTNAAEIAAFLSSANPKWDHSALKSMLGEHLQLTKTEVINRLGKNYNADVADFDAVQNSALMMADMFSDGIVQQYPEKF